MHVNVVEDGEEAIKLIRKERSDMFDSVPLHKRDRIAKSGGPAYSWKRLDTVSADANVVQRSDDLTELPSDEPDKTNVPVLFSNVKSKIKKTVKQQITRSFLLIEKDALIGLTTVQIADYAAMRSFVESEGNDTPSYSILSLFDYANSRNDAPESVSELDLALLSSLYNSPSDVSASMQSAAMIHKMNKELTEVKKGD